MRNLRTAWLPLAIVLVFIVAACAPPPAPTPVPPKPTPAAPAAPAATPTPAPAVKVEPTPTKPPAPKPPIKIGLIQSLTGTLADSGKDNQDGFNLYMESIGWTVAGRKIERVVEDDEGKADVGLTKARKLVESDKVHFIAGLHSTSICYAIRDYVHTNKVVTVITGNCGAEMLTKDPNLRSPYIVRFTQSSAENAYGPAQWMYKNGYRKVVLMGSDYAGGLEVTDGFARAFIEEGGTIVQELYPAMGTTDFGPFLAQIKPGADAALTFIVGADGLRFGQQYAEYGWKGKLPLIDIHGQIAVGPKLVQLKDAAVGVVSGTNWSEAYDSPENKQFLTAWRAKYGDRALSHDPAAGYSGAQIIEAALKAIDGDVENKEKFLQALYKIDLRTPKGPQKLDEYQNIVQNIYVQRADKVGDKYQQTLVDTVPNVSQFWKWKPDEVIKFPWAKFKGKWTNITRDQMLDMLKPYMQ